MTEVEKLIKRQGAGNVLNDMIKAHSLATVIQWLTMLCDENSDSPNDELGAWSRDCVRLGMLHGAIEN